MAKCLICGKELDVPGDVKSVDCGGDCAECMAEVGDPYAVSLLQGIHRNVDGSVTALNDWIKSRDGGHSGI